MSQEWLNGVMQIKISKAGKPYAQFSTDPALIKKLAERIKPGSTLLLTKNDDRIDGMVSRGVKTEEEGQILKEKTSFIKFEASMGPDRD